MANGLKREPQYLDFKPFCLLALRQGEVQDLEGDLGLVLGVDGEFADGVAEMSERRTGAAAGGGIGADLRVKQG